VSAAPKAAAGSLRDRIGRAILALPDAPVWSIGPVRWLLSVLALMGFALVVGVPLDLYSQIAFGLFSFVVAMLLGRIEGRMVSLMLVMMSVTLSFRYINWRLTETLGFDNTPDMIFGTMLGLAELYAFIVLVIGYIQTCWPLERRPVPLPKEVDTWPSVDIFIPTYNEPLDVVSQTVFAAMALDWPKDRLSIHVLDDGRRAEFREFCIEAGVNYLIRDDNRHAKAGNINAALSKTTGEYIAIFDCDHVPTRAFLQLTMGWFSRDAKLAMVQTPHHFFSPDPFEKNLQTHRRVPNEGELFYGVVQPGNDMWNAAFFCGSCAVIKRAPLLEVGGIAVETVTEDAHTALKLHRLGYNSAFIAIPLAAGLATESLSAHIGQRIRWARGMAQIARIDNPLLGKGLGFLQRLCYLNAMGHFFFGLPRLIFLVSPLAYLFFNRSIIDAEPEMIFAYAIPHLLLAQLTNSRLQGRFRHSFWSEVYETVLAWYTFRPTLFALINPRFGKFNVTPKGGTVHTSFFDREMALPYLIVMALTLLGVVFGLFKLTTTDHKLASVLLNMFWATYSVLITAASVAVASEARQIRETHRVFCDFPGAIYFSDGKSVQGRVTDFSAGGFGMTVADGARVKLGDIVRVAIRHPGGAAGEFPATVVFAGGTKVGIRFRDMTVEERIALVQCTFGQADNWTREWGRKDADRPLSALRAIFIVSGRGIAMLGREILRGLKNMSGRTRAAVRRDGATSVEARG